MSLMQNILASFDNPTADEKEDRCKDKKLRENLSEKQVDKMIEDSFPASDPSSFY